MAEGPWLQVCGWRFAAGAMRLECCGSVAGALRLDLVRPGRNGSKTPPSLADVRGVEKKLPGKTSGNHFKVAPESDRCRTKVRNCRKTPESALVESCIEGVMCALCRPPPPDFNVERNSDFAVANFCPENAHADLVKLLPPTLKSGGRGERQNNQYKNTTLK